MPKLGDLINYPDYTVTPDRKAELETLGKLAAQQNRYNPVQMMQELGQKPLANIPYSAYNPTIGQAVNLGANMLPFIGDAAAVSDAKQDYEKGNYGMAAFNAATALPVVGDIASVAKVALPSAAGIAGLVRQMAKRSGDVPVTPFGRQAGVIGYHGTGRKFDDFDPLAEGEYSSPDTRGVVTFTPDKQIAQRYADDAAVNERVWDDELNRYINTGEARVIEADLPDNIKIIDAEGKHHDSEFMIKEQEKAKKEGYAGIQFLGMQDDTFYNPMGLSADTIQIFDPSNIKRIANQ